MLQFLVLGLAALLLAEGLHESQGELFDVIVEADFFPMGQKLQGFDLLKNRFEESYLLSLEIGLLVTTLTLGGLGSQGCKLGRG